MKKLVEKYCEIYPDGTLATFLSVLILANQCSEERVMKVYNDLKEQNAIEIEESANFERLLKSYESI